MKKIITLAFVVLSTPFFGFSQSELPKVTSYIYGKIKEDCPNSLFPDAGKIGEFKKGEVLKITDNKGIHFKIMTNERILYAKKFYFVNPDSLDMVYNKENGKTDSLNAEIAKTRAKYENKNIQENALRERIENSKKLEKFFSKEDVFRWVYKRIEIGMSYRILEAIEGKPLKINKTTTKHGTDEQWVYENKYYYFTNGKLSAIQESK